MRCDDPFDIHLEVLLRLRCSADAAVFDRALEAARLAVARVILAEAERRAGVGSDGPTGTVIKFRMPLRGWPEDGRGILDPGDGSNPS